MSEKKYNINMLNSLKKTEDCVFEVCGYQTRCENCPLNISPGLCVLTKVQEALKEQYALELQVEVESLKDLRW